ncbi:MAG: AraC family transcriptional regulator [Bacteroidales bacterium]|nr:AraC family transcriptional regulator [Bacteroidales bacterium]
MDYEKLLIRRIILRNAGNKDLARARKCLDRWLRDGKHRREYYSMDQVREDMGLVDEELRSYCSSKLKKKFLVWRKEIRMEEARRMLIDYPALPAYMVGRALGIKDKSDFCHQFKSVTGYTPDGWRKKYLKK